MSENQNIEYKESWRDEYLKWICGFANAQGGKIFIGKNDAGKVTGVKDAKRFMEDIPNKVKNILGILVDVNLKRYKKVEFIEINIEAYPYPINYKGQYYYRSGSTKQELKGAALDKFLLQKIGKRWDGVPIPKVSVVNLKQETFDLFRKLASKSQRINEESLSDSNEQLVENLQLKEGEYLKRAALLLFHPAPENFITGSYIKIGYFQSDDDLKFQDEIHGNLFEQIEKSIALLFSRYIKAEISYEGITRLEKFEYPKEAIREALLNAIAHKDYSGGTPIQISVYSDKIIFWNEGQLPENWTIKNLLKKHASRPYNPDIANALFRSGYIESWGRGTIKIINECRKAGIPDPVFSYNSSDISVEFRKDIYFSEYLDSLGLNKRQVKAVLHVKEKGKITNREYQSLYNVSKATATRDLSELENKQLLMNKGTKGSSSVYILFRAIYGSAIGGDFI